jgi:hypothetical protein
MGLDDPVLLQANMLKRRTSEGLLESVHHIAPELNHEQLVNLHASGVWQQWWHAANTEQFYVNDDMPVRAASIPVVNI